MHLISFVRRFKGMEKPIADNRKNSINIESGFSDWGNVDITYREYTGDTAPRHFRGYDAAGIYENSTGRNEFDILKIAADDENIYFYVKCVNKITAGESKKPMILFLNVEDKKSKRWNEYNFSVSIDLIERKATLKKCEKDNEFLWETVTDCKFLCSENELHLKIAKKQIGITGENFSFEFKWSDNMQENDVMDFYINGDAAPRGRLNYVYFFNAKD